MVPHYCFCLSLAVRSLTTFWENIQAHLISLCFTDVIFTNWRQNPPPARWWLALLWHSRFMVVVWNWTFVNYNFILLHCVAFFFGDSNNSYVGAHLTAFYSSGSNSCDFFLMLYLLFSFMSSMSLTGPSVVSVLFVVSII